jgi:hypothetical protein
MKQTAIILNDENPYEETYFVVNAPEGVPDETDLLAGPFGTKEEAEAAEQELYEE